MFVYNKNYKTSLTEGNEDARKNSFSNSVYNFKRTPWFESEDKKAK